MNAHYELSERGYTARMVAGWTSLVVALLLVAFVPAIGLALMLVGVALVFATEYAKRQNQVARRVVTPAPHPDAGESNDRRGRALEYRDLFVEGIISFEEYHNAVADLYPEINRRRFEPANISDKRVGRI